MSTLHRSRIAVTGLFLLLSLALAGLVTATGASARPAPPDGDGVFPAPVAPVPPVVQQIAYGSPLWVFAVVAMAAVVVAVAITLVVLRRRSGATLELPAAAGPMPAGRG